MLLGMKDAERIEGYLRAGWRNDPETRKGMLTRKKRRDVTASVFPGDKPAGGDAVAAVRKAVGQCRVAERPGFRGAMLMRMTQPQEWGRQQGQTSLGRGCAGLRRRGGHMSRESGREWKAKALS